MFAIAGIAAEATFFPFIFIVIYYNHLRSSDLRSVSVIVHSPVSLQFLDKLAQVIGVDLITIEGISPPIHELNHVHLRGVRPNSLLLHLYFVLLDALHLVRELLPVVA